MTLSQAVEEALRLIREGEHVVTAEIEHSHQSRAVSVQYRFVKDKQCDARYRVERRENLALTTWSRWRTSPGFDVADVLSEWTVRAVTGEALYP